MFKSFFFVLAIFWRKNFSRSSAGKLRLGRVFLAKIFWLFWRQRRQAGSDAVINSEKVFYRAGFLKRVVIVGGGFGGVETALRLRKLNRKVEIILVNEDDCFAFAPAFYETAAGELSEGDVCILISKLLSDKGIVYYHDLVQKISLERKEIRTKNMKGLSFDFLVLAVGAKTNFFGIEGVEKNAFSLKTKENAQRIYEYINDALEKGKPHRFVVCGGGLTGVEFAATLKGHILLSCRKFHCNAGDFSVTILQGGKTILPGLPKKAIDFAANYLQKLGIKIVTGFQIASIGKNSVVASDGRQIGFDMAVWAGGLRTHDLIVKSGFQYSGALGERGMPGGGMFVNNFLQLKGCGFVFGAGDCICVDDPNNPVVKTAQNAVDQSKIVAYNIDALIKGKKLKNYSQKKNKFFCALGKKMGMLVDGDRVLTGKKIRQKKERLEEKYVARLRKDLLSSKNIYDS